MFEAEGVATKIEDTGKIFPASDKASDVLEALLSKLQRSGAVLASEEPLLEIDRLENGFALRSTKRSIHARNLVLTTGGQSYPGSGTTGDGYRFAASLGHTIIPPRPALVPITTDAEWVRELRGITITDVQVRVVEPAAEGAKSSRPKPLAERRGSLLFAHFGLSGPAALDVSRAVSGHDRPRPLQLVCDFLPNLKPAQFDEMLRAAAAEAGKKQLISLLPDQLPHRLATALLEQVGLDPTLRAAEVGTKVRTGVVEAVKNCTIPISGTMGFRKAEVTAGGVDLREVDSSTMQSKLVPGLYLAGEVLDLDGPIGGYNFQAAWSAGYLAGASIR
jgi:predicted Rossmann fold flavoprotein